MKAKCVEKGGVTPKSQLVKLALTGCVFPACILCASRLKDGSHTHSDTGKIMTRVGILANRG